MNHKIISQQNHAVLVEWRESNTNMLQRSIVPSDAMAGITEQVLAAGIPFGVQWENYLCEPLAQRLANELRERGFWTYSDASNRIREFRQAVIEIVVASLLDAARGAS